ncbi:neck protein [Mycobacterium phage Aziz]|uniref:Uncharacterized protein n=1 Tax=Mycobacterium phage Aziz TaxID=2762281 RepID=A0A7G8LHG3_9CAUD|nr:neck protein [Mycobacterium phage Aziz]ASR75872.1 hypothetical protein SEA_GENEVAB15_25 [Mycobacterium phage GenevaB15]QNJ56685.1 hypothetical protein SEA_AZIZ_25 [Mycobacterium phage Aziz]
MTDIARVPLEPHLYGPPDGPGIAYFYKESNPAFAEILMSTRVQTITAEWTAQVMSTYIGRIAPRSDPGSPQSLAGSVRAEVYVGGFKSDRWVGEISVESPYAAADEFGRHSPAEGQNNSTYEGSHDLRESLYQHLRPI